MQRLTKDDFAEPADTALFQDEPLIVHQRTEPTANKRLALFVHGLGGSRYGRKSTWGNFPKFIFQDFRELDIGMYQYRTSTGRFVFAESVSLDDEARVIADVVPYHAGKVGTLRDTRSHAKVLEDWDRDAEDAFRVATRALIRVNTMDCLYKKEVQRTNRIGVGITGLGYL